MSFILGTAFAGFLNAIGLLLYLDKGMTPSAVGTWVLAGLMFSLTILSNGNGQGIHAHPGGQAVYIEGEACTVNAVESDEEFINLVSWCVQLHTSK